MSLTRTILLVGGIATTVAVTIIPTFAKFPEFEGTFITWLTSSAVADILITVCLVWSLVSHPNGLDCALTIILMIVVDRAANTKNRNVRYRSYHQSYHTTSVYLFKHHTRILNLFRFYL